MKKRFPLRYTGTFKNKATGTPGEWYLGETPAPVSDPKRPILFIHGFNRSADTWYEDNDMYATAYENGYETAFIDVYPDRNMWENGALLAQKLQEIYQHFGEKLVVVAHSKGGLDTQTALVHYGADPYIERMITLATPYYGSELADLAYSRWGSWLADILGSKNEATYSLQTGSMNHFRSETDNQPNVYQTPIYTLAGTKWGRFGSSLYWGGLYLRSYGSNDGAVTVTSSQLEYANEIQVGDWNHTTIKEGSSTFNVFAPYLQEQVASFENHKAASTAHVVQEPAASNYTSGGEFIGTKKETIYVEQGVQELVLNWSTALAFTHLSLTDPSGVTHEDFTTTQDETTFFEGAHHHTMTVENPEPGAWTLEASSPQQEHYLLTATFTSPLNDLLSTALSSEDRKIKINAHNLEFQTEVTINYYKNGKLQLGNMPAPQTNEATFLLPEHGEGMYNMTMNIHGIYEKDPFRRTIIQSVYADDKGNLY
ncbi:esterase/lipase family protein [Halobacillus sp. K22]|uniref:esterase/lipase family protein n=1 Tax=Halobacillus sp. K22 TaxID=3457431 RepID=UPI003FCECCDB